MSFPVPPPAIPLQRASYLETIETAIGLPLREQYADELVLDLDDCVRVFDALTGFYSDLPFSNVPDVPSAEFVPVFTADVANMIEPGSLLARVGRRFDGAPASPSNRLANLMVYAPRVIISDMLVSYGEMLRQNVEQRSTDDEIVRFVQEELRAMARLSHLFESGTIITYSAYGGDRGVYEAMQDRVELEVGIGLLEDPEMLRWIRSEVAMEFADEWLPTYVGMAISELAESILFTKAFGFNSGPVYSSRLATNALNRVINEVASYDAATLREQERQYQISSNSLIDLSQTDPAAIAQIRFDSKAFELWRAFIDESIARVAELHRADAGFDRSLARDLELRGADFERMLVAEFGQGALASCFRFDAANVIGIVTSAAFGLGGTITGQLSSLLVPLIVERAHVFVSGLSNDRLKRALRSNYHAFVPRQG